MAWSARIDKKTTTRAARLDEIHRQFDANTHEVRAHCGLVPQFTTIIRPKPTDLTPLRSSLERHEPKRWSLFPEMRHPYQGFDAERASASIT
jgi:hypothetical protein